MSSKNVSSKKSSVLNKLLSEKHWSKRMFDPLSIPAIAIVVVCGMTGAGKTVLLTDIMRKRQPRETIIGCCSPECYKSYAYHWPFTRCFDKIDEKFIKIYKRLLAHYGRKNAILEQENKNYVNKVEPAGRTKHEKEGNQKQSDLKQQAQQESWSTTRLESEMKSFKKAWAKRGEELEAVRATHYNKKLADLRSKDIWTAIFDDLSNQTGAWDLPIFTEDAKAGRQSLRSVWFLGQSLLDMKCSNRGQTTTLILYPVMSEKEVTDLFKHWLPACGLKKKEFESLLNFFKQKGWWMVIDRRVGFGMKKNDAVDSDSENSQNIPQGPDPREFISWYTPKQHVYIERYIGSPESIYHHLLWWDIERTQKHVFKNAPKLVKAATKAKKKLSSTGSKKLSTEEVEEEMKEEMKKIDLVRNIGPPDMVNLLKRIDNMEAQLYHRYLSAGYTINSSIVLPSSQTTKPKKKKPSKKDQQSTNRTVSPPPSPMMKSSQGNI
jgi:hypothetical protein